MRKERCLPGPKAPHFFVRINRPPIEHVAREGRMHMHPAVIIKSDELLVKQRVDMR